MLEILMCTPDKTKKDYLKSSIAQILENSGRSASYNLFSYPVDMLDYMYHSSKSIDFVIIDSQFSGESGLEIAKMVKENFPEVKIVITGNTESQVEDLFLIPIDGLISRYDNNDSVNKCINAVLKRVENSSRKHISLKSKNKFVSLRIDDIVVCMSDKRKVIIREFSDHEFYLKLDELQNVIGDEFVRCHQSYLVNMNKIKTFDMEGIILIDNTFVPISQKKYYAIKKIYQEYIKGNHSITVIDT